MRYEEMIKSEDTSGLFGLWSDYRAGLTDYIINTIEAYALKEYLYKNNLSHPDASYTPGDVLKHNPKVLAIWGAGGCNDIDIKRLSEYFRIVLIDRDKKAIEGAKKRYGLLDNQCITIDLGFWDIADEDYRMFEALLIDRAETDDIIKFLQHILDKIKLPDYKNMEGIDYSVVIGMASQLNARFAGLLHIYNQEIPFPKDTLLAIYNKLEEMNKAAVKNMLRAIGYLTKTVSIFGYELEAYLNSEYGEMESRVKALNQQRPEFYVGIVDDNYQISSTIAGSSELHDYLDDLVLNFAIGELDRKYLSWNFTEKKSYIMLLRTFVHFLREL